MNVIKRDNTVEPLDITKIHNQAFPACEGLVGTSASELEVSTQLHFRDGIKTSDIQKILIKTAADLIDVDRPNWTFVASRLKTDALRKQASKYAPTYSEYIKRGIKDSVLSLVLSKYTDKELLEAEAYIDDERDKLLTYQSTLALEGRYLAKKDGVTIESPQQRFMTIALFLASREDNRIHWAKKFYDILSRLEVMTATPTLSTAGLLHSQLSSCYVLDVPDNIEGITTSFHDFAVLSKFGAGAGANISQIRGEDDAIRGVEGASAGIIPACKVYNDLSLYFDQLGVRKGNIATYLNIEHTDIKKFLELKRNSGRLCPLAQ